MHSSSLLAVSLFVTSCHCSLAMHEGPTACECFEVLIQPSIFSPYELSKNSKKFPVPACKDTESPSQPPIGFPYSLGLVLGPLRPYKGAQLQSAFHRKTTLILVLCLLSQQGF